MMRIFELLTSYLGSTYIYVEMISGHFEYVLKSLYISSAKIL